MACASVTRGSGRWPAWIRRVLAAVVLLASITSPRFATADEILDRVLAIAAGDVIMLSDVRLARDLGLVDPGAAVDPDRAILSALIDRALTLDEVNRYAPPEPAVEDVERALAAVRSRVGSQAALDAALARAGIDERQLRTLLRQNLRIRAYLEQRFAGDTPEHMQTAIEEWTAGLRRRADIVDLYQTPTPR